jgi:phosphatidate cytidylyltransferase
MPVRELFALFVIPLLLAVILLAPPWAFLVVLGAAIVLAGDELLAMSRASGVRCGRWLELLILATALGCAWAGGVNGLLAAAVVAALALPTAQLMRPERPEGSLSGSAVGLLVVLYLGLTGACMGWLRQWPGESAGAGLILFFLASIWAGDSGAYYVGRNLGRHKMAPRISPNKTWEGLVGGVIGTLVGAALARFVFVPDLGWLHVLGLAAILAVTAPVGDLVESQLKRDTGIKDSSTLLPGHGGFLDRTDSLLYSAPAVLAYLLATGLVTR